MGLVEVIIAIFLTTIGLMALLTLQPTAGTTTLRSDFIGRASGILYKTLEDYENRIINPCSSITLGDQDGAGVSVHASGGSTPIPGDITYNVNAEIAQDAVSAQGFLVTVTVTWTNTAEGNTRSISESLTVARQEFSRFPAACPNGTVN